MTHPGDCEADAASAALAPYCPCTAARVTVLPVAQVGVQGSQTGYTPRKQQRTHQDECPSRFKLWGQHYMALPAQLHASAALAPYCLKLAMQTRLDRNWRIYPKGVWFGKGPGRAGGKDEVQQEGAQVQKKGSHLQKNCSKVQ